MSDLRLRPPCLSSDEHPVRELQLLLRAEGHHLGLQVDHCRSWHDWFALMADQRQGYRLDPAAGPESPMMAISTAGADHAPARASHPVPAGAVLIGAVWLRPGGGHRGHLELAVHPHWRGRGHGTRILTLALPVLAARGLATAIVPCPHPGAARVLTRHGGRPLDPTTTGGGDGLAVDSDWYAVPTRPAHVDTGADAAAGASDPAGGATAAASWPPAMPHPEVRSPEMAGREAAGREVIDVKAVRGVALAADRESRQRAARARRTALTDLGWYTPPAPCRPDPTT